MSNYKRLLLDYNRLESYWAVLQIFCTLEVKICVGEFNARYIIVSHS